MKSPRANIYFLILSIACQILGLAAGHLTFRLMDTGWIPAPAGEISSIVIFVAVFSTTALLASVWLGLPLAWRYFNLLLAPAAISYEVLQLPSALLITVLVFCLLIYLPTFWTRIPYYPSSPLVYDTVSALIAEHQPKRFIDLGSGFGPLLFFLAKKHPEVEFFGCEISLLPFLVSRIRAKLSRTENLHFTAKSFWDITLSDYDFVYAFLAPPPMPAVWEKVQKEMRKVSVFVSNSFPPPAEADKIIGFDDGKKTRLYVYNIS